MSSGRVGRRHPARPDMHPIVRPPPGNRGGSECGEPTGPAVRRCCVGSGMSVVHSAAACCGAVPPASGIAPGVLGLMCCRGVDVPNGSCSSHLQILLPMSATSGATSRHRPGGRQPEQALDCARPSLGVCRGKDHDDRLYVIRGHLWHLCDSAGCLESLILG